MHLGQAIIGMNLVVGVLTLFGGIYMIRMRDQGMGYLLLIISAANFYLGWQFYLGLQ